MSEVVKPQNMTQEGVDLSRSRPYIKAEEMHRNCFEAYLKEQLEGICGMCAARYNEAPSLSEKLNTEMQNPDKLELFVETLKYEVEQNTLARCPVTRIIPDFDSTIADWIVHEKQYPGLEPHRDPFWQGP